MLRHPRAQIGALGLVLTLGTALWAQNPFYPKYDYYPRSIYYPIGYQFYGWSGWGVPPQIQNEIARGMGIYAAGVTQAHARAAQAGRNEMIRRWNSFLWAAQHAVNVVRTARRFPLQARNPAALQELMTRVRDNPSPADIESGAALNALFDQVTDPRIPYATVRMPRTPLNPKLIQQIPLEYSSEVISFLLQRLTAEEHWPAFLRGKAYAEPYQAIRSASTSVLEQDRAGEVSDEAVRKVNDAVQELAAKMAMTIPKSSPEFRRAETFLKELVGLARLLGKPNYDAVLAALDKNPNSTLEDLLAFMQMFNLRFGAASTEAQKSAYQTLYPMLARWRNNLVRLLGNRMPQRPVNLRAEGPPPLALFSGMGWDQLVGKAATQEAPAQPGPER